MALERSANALVSAAASPSSTKFGVALFGLGSFATGFNVIPCLISSRRLLLVSRGVGDFVSSLFIF